MKKMNCQNSQVEKLRTFVVFVCLCVILLAFCRPAGASGVPISGYQRPLNLSFSGVYVGSNDYQWMEQQADGLLVYYKELLKSGTPEPQTVWVGISGSCRGYRDSGNGFGVIILQGYSNGYWYEITKFQADQLSHAFAYSSFLPNTYTEFRLVGAAVVFPGNSIRVKLWGEFSLAIGYYLGADQASADAIYSNTVYNGQSAAYWANQGYAAANAAKSSADTAAYWANQGYAAANAAKSSAVTAAYWANQGYAAANTAATNTAYGGQSAAYWAYLAAANATPRIEKMQGLNGATCTTGSSFTVVISASPSSGVQYRVTCNAFDSGWTTSNQITISSGLVYGANTATVQVRNAAGNTAQASFTFFKL